MEKEFEGSISLEGREEGLGGIKGEAGAKVKKSNTLTEIIAAINEAKIPFAVSELVLENILHAVRENMAAEEAAAANIETPKTEEEKMPN